MKVFLPSRPRKPYGWALLALAVSGAAAAAALYFARPADRPALPEEPVSREEREYWKQMEAIQNEIDRNTDAMFQAEEFGDRAAYMGLARKSAEKIIEGDRAWSRWRSSSGPESAPVLGVRHAVTGELPLRFSDEQKLDMLAAEHGVTRETLLMIKAELEVLFAEEWVQKFGDPHEHEDHEGGERDE